MPRRTGFKLPKQCRKENPKYNREEQKHVIRSILKIITFGIRGRDSIKYTIRDFGTISTRSNRKDKTAKISAKNLEKRRKEARKQMELSLKKLLY